MKFLAMDLETGGLDPSCSLLEAAFVEFDTQDGKPVEGLNSYVIRFKPDRLVIEPDALRLHLDNGLLHLCLTDGFPEPEAWIRIAAYLNQYLVRTQQTRVTLAGKNLANFDLHFVPKWLKSRFHYRVLDVGSMLVRSTDRALPSLTECLQRSGLKSAGSGHRALADAQDVARVVLDHLAWQDRLHDEV